MSRSTQSKPKCDISQPNGQIINYPDGSQYIGMINSTGIPHGLGWYKEKYGKAYKGTFENGKFTYGCMNDTYGNEFYGSFVNNLLHGKGYAIYTNPDDWRSPTGRDMYEGNFVNGQPKGSVRVTHGESQPFMMIK
jgi:hypothetical protein